MAEAPACLRVEGIDNDGSVGTVRRAKLLRDDGGFIIRGRGIRDTSEGLETTREAAGARRWDQGIYDDDGGVERGRQSRRLQQLQRMRRRRIYNASKGLKTTADAAADRRRAWWIGNNNGVLIFLHFRLLTLTLSHLYLVAVSF